MRTIIDRSQSGGGIPLVYLGSEWRRAKISRAFIVPTATISSVVNTLPEGYHVYVLAKFRRQRSGPHCIGVSQEQAKNIVIDATVKPSHILFQLFVRA